MTNTIYKRHALDNLNRATIVRAVVSFALNWALVINGYFNNKLESSKMAPNKTKQTKKFYYTQMVRHTAEPAIPLSCVIIQLKSWFIAD